MTPSTAVLDVVEHVGRVDRVVARVAKGKLAHVGIDQLVGDGARSEVRASHIEAYSGEVDAGVARALRQQAYFRMTAATALEQLDSISGRRQRAVEPLGVEGVQLLPNRSVLPGTEELGFDGLPVADFPPAVVIEGLGGQSAMGLVGCHGD